MKNPIAVFARYYDNENSAKKAAQRLNKEKGKNVYIAVEEKDGSWLVIHISQLLTG